jgi:outer membrane protein assembly factor BamE (lipoprotein component of BamABCDE complex)
MNPKTLAATPKRLFAAAVLALAAGCTTVKVGRDFDFGAFAARMKHGETTMTQVQEWLGPPVGTGQVLEVDGTRNEQWTWYYGSGKIPGGQDTSFKMLQVKFNEAGRLISYNWSGETRPSGTTEKR